MKQTIVFAALFASVAAQGFDLAGPKGPGLPDWPRGNAPNPGPLVHGEKEWQDWAQYLVDWEDHQTDMANTRIPYSSYL